MVGVSAAEGNSALKELLKDQNIKASQDKVMIVDTWEIEKQVKFYRKMDKINQARQVSKSK